jgi:uroporphyrinogen III methyltransferase/synthase
MKVSSEDMPLAALQGLRVVVTRASHEAEELARPLRELGADVILLPLIGIAPPVDPGPLRQAAAHANDYDWIIFTSKNAVSAFAPEMPESCKPVRARIGTIGTATREAAEKLGFSVSITPAEYVAESLLEAFSAEDLDARRVLIPSAAVTRDIVPTELRKRGAHVDVVEAYRNVMPSEAVEQAALIFREPYPDWVCFASSSAVENLIELIGVEPLRRTKIATIGPITSNTVRKHGLNVSAEAGIHTMRGLVDVLCETEVID